MPTAHWLLWRGLLVLVSASVVSALHARPAATQQMEDVGYLKDGGIVRGTIIEQRPGESLRIQARDGNVFRYAMDQIERIAKEPIPAAALGPKQKSPALAWFLSFLIAGGGQAYNGQWGKGAAFFGSSVLGFALLSSGAADCIDDDTCGTATAGAVIWLGSWIASQIDAPVSASAINRRIRGGVGLQIQPRLFVVAPASRPRDVLPVEAFRPTSGPRLGLGASLRF